jgi:hypothetical protein
MMMMMMMITTTTTITYDLNGFKNCWLEISTNMDGPHSLYQDYEVSYMLRE